MAKRIHLEEPSRCSRFCLNVFNYHRHFTNNCTSKLPLSSQDKCRKCQTRSGKSAVSETDLPLLRCPEQSGDVIHLKSPSVRCGTETAPFTSHTSMIQGSLTSTSSKSWFDDYTCRIGLSSGHCTDLGKVKERYYIIVKYSDLLKPIIFTSSRTVWQSLQHTISIARRRSLEPTVV